jgi:hypothetical protein
MTEAAGGTRFERAIAAIDAVHAEDRARDASGRPAELAYAEHMSTWLSQLAPQASEALRLAVRCQHIRRWAISRGDYPEGRIGYLRWRKEESLAHAGLAAELLAAAGYDPQTIARVQSLVKKERLKQDPEAQLLEDVICLVFLERELGAFAAKHDEAKLVEILKKTWAKMSSRGQAEAMKLELPAPLAGLVEKALA